MYIGREFFKGVNMEQKLKAILETGLAEIKLVKDKNSLLDFKIKYLGKQGELTSILRGMRDVQPQDRPKIGVLVNEVREKLEGAYLEKEKYFNDLDLQKELEKSSIDITEPSRGIERGELHPTTKMFNKLIDICVAMGFQVVEGPEIETDYYNFEGLNIPKNHPSRDMQDTFFITENILLRSQTSSVQVRAMESMKPPIKIIVPGRVYRNDSDGTHSPVFHQLEGLVIDENVSMADLKAMLTSMMGKVFGETTKIRFRPSFFPFTEPSVEVDVSCPSCKGTGCKVCKGSGYLELLGAGVVNPKVLEMSGIDSKKYRGFAFGFGVDRFAMVYYGITDLKNMFKNDARFLNQIK